MQPPSEDVPGPVESPPEPDPGAFDPGVETGYLRRAPREGTPDVELGARPFDPGDEVGFDDRRAKRRRRRREREERERAEAEGAARREAEEAAAREEERSRAEAEEAERHEAEERAHAEAEEAERLEAEQARREAAEGELEEAEERAVAEAEGARREAEERDRAEREARARAEAERAKRKAGEARRREQTEREREEAEERRKRAAEAKARKRRAKAPARSGGPSKRPRPARARPGAARPPATRRVRRPARPMPPPGAATPGRARPAPAQLPKAPGLAAPTAKLGGTMAAVMLGIVLLGSLLGLPTPFSGSEGGVASLNAQGVPVGSGTAAALYRGPFHPVRGEYGYGEKGAEFGADRGGRRHEGQDIFSKRGNPLVAVRDGVVVDRAKASGAYSGGRGNYLVIYNPIENRSFVYLHMLEPAVVEKGERVHAGQLVGLMGCTGSCYGTHLHFELRRGRASFAADTKAIDPLPFLQGLPQAPEELTEP